MIGQRSFPNNHLFALLVTAAALIAAAVLVGLATAPKTAQVAAPPAAGGANASERAQLAEGDRWTGLAQRYSNRASQAEADRWSGLANLYVKSGAGYDAVRAEHANAARWTGLAGMYPAAGSAGSASASERAGQAEAARYTGLAIQEYYRTGDQGLLPECITPEIAAALPGIGDNSWQTVGGTCGK